MGSVYRALDTRIGKDVAVKMLAPPADGKPMTEQLKQRFLREVLAICASSIRTWFGPRLRVHRRRSPVHGDGILEDPDLNEILKATREPLATSYAVDIMMEVCSALRGLGSALFTATSSPRTFS